MLIRQYFAAGIRNVLRSWRMIVALYLVNLGLCIPLAIAMHNVLENSVGSSLVQEKLRHGFDLDWYGEFEASSSGFARTFGPSVISILPVAANIERILDGTLFGVDGVVLLPAIVFLLIWAFFGGGILVRYARPLETWSAGAFVRDSAEYSFRCVRLTILSIALYLAVVKLVAGPLHKWVEAATRDVTVERTAMAYTGLVYVLTVLLLALLTLVVDYAKIMLVVERRRSSLLAFIDSIRFICANCGATLGLYVSLATVGIAALAVWGWIAPGATQSSVPALAASFALAQTFVISRVTLKLWFLAGQTALFQSRRVARVPRASAPGTAARARESEDAGGDI